MLTGHLGIGNKLKKLVTERLNKSFDICRTLADVGFTRIHFVINKQEFLVPQRGDLLSVYQRPYNPVVRARIEVLIQRRVQGTFSPGK